jgi:multidrug efflux pump subunit AcrB
MENVKQTEGVSVFTFIKYQIYKFVNAFFSAIAITFFILVLIFLWFRIVIPWFNMLK